MLVNVTTLLTEARAGKYAIGAFNTVNLETTIAIIEAAQELSSPVIVQMTEKTFTYAGAKVIVDLVTQVAEERGKDIPIGIHLDHGRSLESVEQAMDAGLTSVMYDGSRKEYAENFEMTKTIVELAH